MSEQRVRRRSDTKGEATVDVTGRPVRSRKVHLDRFFSPRTVAVIGASDTPRRPNTAMWRKIRKWAERAESQIYPVNPNRDEVDGITCYRTVLDVPGELDLAIILVGDAVEMFETVLERKPLFAVIFGAGFAEVDADGAALQERLESLIESGDTHLLGPNTNLNAFETFRDDLAGPKVALITQSGHQGRPVFQAQEHGLAISHWAPTGNEADLEFADFATWFADQPDTGAIAAYIEGFKDGRTLMLAADHAAGQGVPIVCVKVGRTEEGRSMAHSHTGHLTGSDAVTSAVFRQFGITRVDGLDELQDVAMTFTRTVAPKQPGRRNVCVYAISGGTGAHMADLCAGAGLALPDLSSSTQEALRSSIPGYLRVSNPVDSGGPPSADSRGIAILRAIVADPLVDAVICPITGALASISKPLARDLVTIAKETDKPIFVIWGSPLNDEEPYTEVLLPSSLPVYRTFHNCVQAVVAWFDYHEFAARYRSPFAKPTARRHPGARRVDELLATGRPLAEHESKEVLRAYGIATTDDLLVGSATEAARAAGTFDGPVVLKVASPDLLHKSDHGLVHMGLTTASAVKRAHGELLDAAAQADPEASIHGVLVCEMVTGGVETAIGVSYDDLFGPVVMFGLGGVFIEVFEDVTFRVPPFDRNEAQRMVREVRGFRLLEGVRGHGRADVGALVDAIMRVQRLAVDHAEHIDEIDINPFVVLTKGARALDALIIPR